MPAYFRFSSRPDVGIVVSDRTDGDFNAETVDHGVLDVRRQKLVAGPWTQLQEEHGTEARWVMSPREHEGATGDILATRSTGLVLGVWVGDCAPLVIAGAESIVAVHAGWKGLRDGVLDKAFETLSLAGDNAVEAFLGPHIRACCYEFGAADLRIMSDRFGSVARSCDSKGRPALDVSACISAVFQEKNVLLRSLNECTGCAAGRYFSHRVRGERERQIVGVWSEL